MFDAHNHLDRCGSPAADLAHARGQGVRGMVVAGVDPAGWRAQAGLAAAAADIFCSFGLHPWTAARLDDAGLAAGLEALAAALDGELGVKPVALGELGLDRTRHVPPDSAGAQEAAFRAQLALARARDLPVVLHIVRAHGRALDILRADGLPAAGGQLHSASTPADMVPAWLELGLHLSFGPQLTRHPKARQAAAEVPLDRLLVETDAPDQPPAGQEGPNRPGWLGLVVAALAEVKGVSFDDLAALTEANARRCFRLPPSPDQG